MEHPVFQLKELRKHYESYVPMEYKVYLKRMKRFLLNTDLSCSLIHYPGRHLLELLICIFIYDFLQIWGMGRSSNLTSGCRSGNIAVRVDWFMSKKYTVLQMIFLVISLIS